MLTTIGGASVGDHDLIRAALAAASMTLDFWRIAMRPGKPLIHGRLGAISVLGLPGNPTSATVCAVLFLRPLIRALLGDPAAAADPSEPARLGAALPAVGERKDYLRAVLTADGGGAITATPIADQDSSLAKALARADALLVRATRRAARRGGRELPDHPPGGPRRLRFGRRIALKQSGPPAAWLAFLDCEEKNEADWHLQRRIRRRGVRFPRSRRRFTGTIRRRSFTPRRSAATKR